MSRSCARRDEAEGQADAGAARGAAARRRPSSQAARARARARSRQSSTSSPPGCRTRRRTRPRPAARTTSPCCARSASRRRSTSSRATTSSSRPSAAGSTSSAARKVSGLALRLPRGRPRADRAGALPLGARPPRAEGLHARPPARARARGRHGRHRVPAHRRGQHLPARARRPVPDGHVRGGARRLPRRRDAGRERPAAPLRRLLDQLPPRGRRRGQGHARDVPRAPVRQGGDVRARAARGVAGGAPRPARDRGGARRRARPRLPRGRHRRRRPGRLGRAQVRHRGVVPGPEPLPRGHLDVEHDRLPGRPAPPRHRLPPRAAASASPCTP